LTLPGWATLASLNREAGREGILRQMKFCPNCGKRLRLLTGRSRGQALCPSCGTRVAEGERAEEPVEAVKTAIVKSFPYATMRPYQREVLEKIEAAIGAGKKFIILEAPVGFGKSAVAAAVCRNLRSAYVLTSTKQLQEQYSADFGFTTVMGKSNFTCLVPTSSGRLVACSKGRCEADWSLSDCPHYLSFDQYEDHLKGLCDKESKCEKTLRREGEGKLCTYYKQKWDSFREKVTVGNYAFFFSELRYTEDVRKRRLLVCDEAHDLERQLVGSASFTLKASTIRQYPPGDGREFSVAYEEGMESHAEDWIKTLGSARDSLQGFYDSHEGDMAAQDRVISCRGLLESLEAFIDSLKSAPDNWIVTGMRKAAALDPYGGGPALVDEVVFQPLEVAAYTSQLFGTAETVLLMSATVFSEELLCRTLGIPQDRAEFVRVSESTFPVENRRIYAMDVAQLNRASLDASLESIAKAVDEIMDRHANERGVVHTTSYHQANYIIEHVSEQNRKRLVTTEGSMARTQLLHTHGATGASVLISPSLYQGVDLKDDLARFQVIVKVPFSDLSDRRTQVKMQRERGWYDWQTALRLVQTYGRSVRSETDSAVTYVLDSNFGSFVRGHMELFPQYFLDALTEPEAR
jgi:ATP-dependent DNA helicase DinG